MKRLRWFGARLALTIAIALAIPAAAHAATTYTWNGSTTSDWGEALNWTPNRTTPAPDDIIVFDGAVTPTTNVIGPSLGLDNVGQIRLMNAAVVTIELAYGPATILVAGDAGDDFVIPAGCMLVIGVGVGDLLTVQLGAGATAMVQGTLENQGLFSVIPADPHAFVCESGGVVQNAVGSGGTLFPVTTFPSAEFRAGSTFLMESGTAPHGTIGLLRVTYLPGSLFIHRGGSPGSLARAHYGDFEWDNASLNVGFGSVAGSVHNLRIRQGGYGYTTGIRPVYGNITVDPGAQFNLFGSGAELHLSGTSVQTLGGGGSFAMSGSTSLHFDGAGYALTQDLPVDIPAHLTSGVISTGANALVIGNGVPVIVGAGRVDGTVRHQINGLSATATLAFPFGDATHGAPASVTLNGISASGDLTGSTTGSDHPSLATSGLNAARSVNRYWSFDATAPFSSADVTVTWDPADLDPGVTPAALLGSKFDLGVWLPQTLSSPPTASATFTLVPSLSDFVLAETAAITLSPPTLPAAPLGVPYSQPITASGGTAPYTFSVTSGSLPPGLALSLGGSLGGTPTTPGVYLFDVTATDALSATGVRGYSVSVSAATYTWNAASGSWTTASNWTPTRTTPGPLDELTFDGAVTPTASVTGIPAEQFGLLRLINGAQVTFAGGVPTAGVGTISRSGSTVTGTGTNFPTQLAIGDIIYGNTTLATYEVLSIASNTILTTTSSGAVASQAFSIGTKLRGALQIDSGCLLDINTTTPALPPISMFVPTGKTGAIAGELRFSGNVHRLFAADVNAITVASGGKVVSGTGYIGNPFTASGTANIVRFQSGSEFVFRAGSNPFGLAAPNSKVVFEAGSSYRHESTNLPSLSNRIYANFVFNVTGAPAIPGGATPCLMDDLTVQSGTMTIQGASQPLNVRGNLTVASGAAFEYKPTTSNTTFAFSGTSPQSVNGSGALVFGPNANVFLVNGAGLTLNRDVSIEGQLVLAGGNITIPGSSVLTMVNATGISSGGNWIDGFLAYVLPSGASVTRQYPVGDAGAKSPLTVTLSNVSNSGSGLVARTISGEHPQIATSGLDASKSLNRHWVLWTALFTPPAFTTADVTLEYPASDLDGGAVPANFVVGKYDAPTWSLPAHGVGTSASIQATGLTSFSHFAVAEPACGLITVAPPTLPGGTVGAAYSQTITASGGTAPYTFAATLGAPPPGLTLAAGGALTGTPTTPGTYPFTVEATDASSCTGSLAYSITIAAPVDDVAAVSPPGCLSTANPCVTVPVTWTRTDATPARGYSVRIQLSANLSLCGAGIASAGYLAGGATGTPIFLVTPLGGGQYVVDESTLGSPCGATGSGTLFTIPVTSTDPGGTGTVTIVSAIARDCANVPIPANAGGGATITIDNVVPVAVALSAAQKKTGNVQPPDGTTDVELTWSGQEPGSSVAVYRKGFGGYPQYDENGGATPSAPATPAAAVLAGWQLSPVVATGAFDRTAARDFWHYVAFVTDPCGNVSVVSNPTGGTLNYHLADFHDGTTNCAGNDLVNTSDLSFLGANYGVAVAVNGALECLDVGPTTDFSVDARPTTDNLIQFEDLMMLAINHGQVSAPQSRLVPVAAAASRDAVGLRVPALSGVGTTFAVGLGFEGTGRVQGLSATLAFDNRVVEFLGVERGALVDAQGSEVAVLSSRPGIVDVAAVGTGAALVGEGEIARAVFRVRSNGDPAIAIRTLDGRDQQNRAVALIGGGVTAGATGPLPTRTALSFAGPNPFRDATALELALAERGEVSLAVFGLDGRRVRSLADGAFEPGSHRFAWDGRDDAGRDVPAGMYFVRLSTGTARLNRALVRVR